MDNRGRVALPARLVTEMRSFAGVAAEGSFEVVISVSMEGRVGIFPRPVYDRILENLEKAPKEDALAAELRRSYLNYMDIQNTDKQNRVRIPQLLADYYRLEGEVVLMGSGEYLEVVNKDDWRMHLEARAAMFSQNRGVLGRFLAGKGAEAPAREENTPGGVTSG